MRKNHTGQKMAYRYLALIAVVTLPILLTACSSSFERGDQLVAADEMKQGPGIFSGKKGSFYLVGGEEKTAATKPLGEMNLEETSRVINNKIKQLDQDKKELELLKLELDKKLRS